MTRLLVSAVLFLFCGAAMADPLGGTMAVVLTTDCGPECQSVSWFQGERARVDVLRAMRQTMLFDASTGVAYRFVPGEDTYAVLNAGEIDTMVSDSVRSAAENLRKPREQGLAQIDSWASASRESLERMPPEQQKLIEQQLAEARSQFEARMDEAEAASTVLPWTAERTGKKERVGHWDCELVRIVTGGVGTADAWIAPADKVVPDASALRLGAAMANALGHSATSGWTAPLALKTTDGSPAVVVKANFLDTNKRAIGTMEIRSVETRPVPPGHFDLPAGLFKKRLVPP